MWERSCSYPSFSISPLEMPSQHHRSRAECPAFRDRTPHPAAQPLHHYTEAHYCKAKSWEKLSGTILLVDPNPSSISGVVAPSIDHLPVHRDSHITYLDHQMSSNLRACGHRRRAIPTTIHEALNISTLNRTGCISRIGHNNLLTSSFICYLSTLHIL